VLTEKILLGLRSNIGIEESILDEKIKQNADFLVEHQKLTKLSSTYYNPNFFLSDEIALYLLK